MARTLRLIAVAFIAMCSYGCAPAYAGWCPQLDAAMAQCEQGAADAAASLCGLENPRRHLVVEEIEVWTHSTDRKRGGCRVWASCPGAGGHGRQMIGNSGWTCPSSCEQSADFTPSGALGGEVEVGNCLANCKVTDKAENCSMPGSGIGLVICGTTMSFDGAGGGFCTGNPPPDPSEEQCTTVGGLTVCPKPPGTCDGFAGEVNGVYTCIPEPPNPCQNVAEDVDVCSPDAPPPPDAPDNDNDGDPDEEPPEITGSNDPPNDDGPPEEFEFHFNPPPPPRDDGPCSGAGCDPDGPGGDPPFPDGSCTNPNGCQESENPNTPYGGCANPAGCANPEGGDPSPEGTCMAASGCDSPNSDDDEADPTPEGSCSDPRGCPPSQPNNNPPGTCSNPNGCTTDTSGSCTDPNGCNGGTTPPGTCMNPNGCTDQSGGGTGPQGSCTRPGGCGTNGTCDPGEECGEDGQASGGTSCGAAPACSGDPIQCMVAYQAWETRCAVGSLEEAITNDPGGLGTDGDANPNDLWDTTDDGPGFENLDSEGMGLTRQCPMSNLNFAFLEDSVSVSGEPICQAGSIIGILVLLLAYIQAARIIGGK